MEKPEMARAIAAALVVAMVVLAAVFFWPDVKSSFRSNETAEEFNVTIFHTRYEPNSISVKQGSMVKLNVLTAEGTSSHMHGITIDDYGINELVTSETKPKTMTFRADGKGTLVAYCGTCLNGPFGREHPEIKMTIVIN